MKVLKLFSYLLFIFIPKVDDELSNETNSHSLGSKLLQSLLIDEGKLGLIKGTVIEKRSLAQVGDFPDEFFTCIALFLLHLLIRVYF